MKKLMYTDRRRMPDKSVSDKLRLTKVSGAKKKWGFFGIFGQVNKNKNTKYRFSFVPRFPFYYIILIIGFLTLFFFKDDPCQLQWPAVRD